MGLRSTREQAHAVWGEHPKPLTPEQRDAIAIALQGETSEWERDLRRKLR